MPRKKLSTRPTREHLFPPARDPFNFLKSYTRPGSPRRNDTRTRIDTRSIAMNCFKIIEGDPPPFPKRKNFFFSIFRFSFIKVPCGLFYSWYKIRTLADRLVPEKPKFSKSMFRKKFMFLATSFEFLSF